VGRRGAVGAALWGRRFALCFCKSKGAASSAARGPPTKGQAVDRPRVAAAADVAAATAKGSGPAGAADPSAATAAAAAHRIYEGNLSDQQRIHAPLLVGEGCVCALSGV
jgi:hypothetical protein